MIHSVNVALEIARIAFKKTCNIIAVIHFGNYIKSTSYHFVKPALSKGLLAQAYNLIDQVPVNAIKLSLRQSHI